MPLILPGEGGSRRRATLGRTGALRPAQPERMVVTILRPDEKLRTLFALFRFGKTNPHSAFALAIEPFRGRLRNWMHRVEETAPPGRRRAGGPAASAGAQPPGSRGRRGLRDQKCGPQKLSTGRQWLEALGDLGEPREDDGWPKPAQPRPGGGKASPGGDTEQRPRRRDRRSAVAHHRAVCTACPTGDEADA
jgi:hypothetical protein